MYLYVGVYNWGVGDTKREARKAALRHGPLDRYVLYEVFEGTFVDEYGYIITPRQSPRVGGFDQEDRERAPVLISSKGVMPTEQS